MNEIEKKRYVAEERRIVVGLMMIVGGMMGGYTYITRGGVFCNAQTGNVLLMGMALGNGQWSKSLYYLIPFAAYLLGTFVSEVLRAPGRKYYSLKWNTCFTGLELAALFGIGFIPLSAPDQIVQVAVNFLASIQYNSFRKTEGVPMATTFCTNHVRQMGIWMADYRKTHNPSSKSRILLHVIMLLCFLSGTASVAMLAPVLHEKTIWLAVLPLAVAFFFLLFEDLCIVHQENHAWMIKMQELLHMPVMNLQESAANLAGLTGIVDQNLTAAKSSAGMMQSISSMSSSASPASLMHIRKQDASIRKL